MASPPGRPRPTPSVPEPIPSELEGCPFCYISESFPPYEPLHPPRGPPLSRAPASDATDHPDAFILLSTPLLVAFLDIAPLARGHLLLCPRQHRAKLTDATPDEANELGSWLRIVSAALVRSTGVADWNIVQNNGAAAAQVVHHAHFHIIPRPEIREQGRWREQFTMFGRGSRTTLDEDDATALAARIRDSIAEVLDQKEYSAKL